MIELDSAASALLDILVDLGHLDDRLLALVNDRLLDEQPADGVVDHAALRRVAAEVLFDSLEGAEPDQRRVLEEEWGLLFY